MLPKIIYMLGVCAGTLAPFVELHAAAPFLGDRELCRAECVILQSGPATWADLAFKYGTTPPGSVVLRKILGTVRGNSVEQLNYQCGLRAQKTPIIYAFWLGQTMSVHVLDSFVLDTSKNVKVVVSFTETTTCHP